MFPGNQNADKVHRNDLSSPFEARYVRINPTQWNEAPSMRVELYGCLAGNSSGCYLYIFDGGGEEGRIILGPTDFPIIGAFMLKRANCNENEAELN